MINGENVVKKLRCYVWQKREKSAAAPSSLGFVIFLFYLGLSARFD